MGDTSNLVDKDKLREFLTTRKFALLQNDRVAKGAAKQAIIGQLQAIDSMLIFLTTSQEAHDMDALKLSLDKQAKPLEDLAPRTRSSGLTEALTELVSSLKPGTYRQIDTREVKPKSIVAKVYALKKTGVLPKDVYPVTRKGGAEVYIAKAKN